MRDLKEYKRQWHLANCDKVRERAKKWAKDNPERRKQITQRWLENNPEKRRDVTLKYHQKTREVRQRKVLEKYRGNPSFRLSRLLRSRIWNALKNNRKAAHTIELIGCKWSELRMWLEFQFQDGMTWENYGPIWHVDHIQPCASFDLSDPEQQKECFNYKNLQPLFALDNFRKGAKY